MPDLILQGKKMFYNGRVSTIVSANPGYLYVQPQGEHYVHNLDPGVVQCIDGTLYYSDRQLFSNGCALDCHQICRCCVKECEHEEQ